MKQKGTLNMLEVVSSKIALERVLADTAGHTETESVSIFDAAGRISAEDIRSPEDLPPFPRSTVDGYAVRAADTYGCSESIPAMLLYEGEILMGEAPEKALKDGSCMKIPTGGELPEGADAVCMVEYSDDIGDEFRYLYRPVSVSENVLGKGDDCRIGETVLKKGERIRSKSIAILAALGISEICVYRPVKIGVISTGDELIPFTEKPEGAQIRDINSVMLAASARESGAEATCYPLVRDQEEDLTAAVRKALAENDLVCISGGSSAGEKDNTRKVLEKLGDLKFHGISIKPGKPTMFAAAGGKPVFGLPGHPQAAFFIFRLFVLPCIRKLLSENDLPRKKKLILSRNIPSNHGREEIVPVRIRGNEAEPIHSKSGVVSVLSYADGYLLIERDQEGLPKGSEAEVFLF